MKALDKRPYQDRAVGFFQASKSRRLVMTGPTGSGKTVIAARIVLAYHKRAKRVLIVVHRRELVLQMLSQLERAGVAADDIGVIMGTDAETPEGRERVNPLARIQICSAQTLAIRDIRPKADLVIVDECHRVMADSYQAILGSYPKARHLGFTASPVRFDGRGLGEFYDELYVIALPSELLTAGFLVEPKAFTVPENKRPSLKGLRVSKGDYSLKELEARVNKTSLVGQIAEELRRHAGDRQTVIFAVGIQHAEHVLKRVRRAKFTAEMISGATPLFERDRILNAFAKRQIQVIVNCNVLTEGWDMPICKCVVLARPTRSLSLFLQMTGRFERPYKGIRPILLDHVGACLRKGFGLPTDDRKWKLSKNAESDNGSSELPRKECTACNALVHIGAMTCDECGFVFPARDSVPDETADRLIEFVAFKQRLEEFAQKRGIGNDWVEKVLDASRN